MSELQSSDIELFERLSSYPFGSDREFAVGLSIILGHPESPASEEEINRSDDLTLQAKCFYFSRKEKLTPPLDFSTYKAWLESASTSKSADLSSPGPTVDVPKSQEEPTYPSSFAHIVELITTGQPIPGIQQIPDTVLTGHDKPSEKPERRKPWEKGIASK
ncbi:hypothetical protein CBS63078_10980 [Aspergillus niger]|uniref:Contig An09c0220, genomic contig n=5 Tax=Aspergillus subgen. Circumdati TaxID=2720871 RepID=A2QUU5_ASPNC|nr:uncharacterized protein An09g06820 [Aspergillus niger]XP_025458775.1 uncharacterized protein BO96DRAFT_408860 [Aspergillus niger CBS 101883]XP_026625599.1 hypothetical protein BDQ94DRAFT_144594 [Aspergillus welwitschiae]EHA28622.1 hypothetical protein ASPNIDRAFT_188168 [Aspergillus niger ATCC 1015]RDH15065.1 hypothetical protein M747DRAFT_269080 [Aspergillus niger ATCC 13496]RDK37908.1 hypothetical protein M752DRAFT_279209 [Aspergillus phoenicis ATCC 13157]KAI2815626.1 hypothetical protein|eukprot:XP_001393997.1 hypothetical protein ANI_1_902084 [Aspergillus niger CBS 513.88]